MFAVPREQLLRVHASSGTTGKPTVVGYTKRRPRYLGGPDGALLRLRRRVAGRYRAQRLRLRPVHRRPRRALRGGAARLHGGADVGRRHRAPGDLDQRFQSQRVVCDAVLRAQYRGDRAKNGRRSETIRRCGSVCSGRSRGATPCAATSRPGSGSRQWMSTVCPKSWGPAWPASATACSPGCTAGRIISCSRSSIRKRMQPLPLGATGELVITTLTKEALPMIRYRTRDITRLSRRALRLRAHPCPHPAGHRPQRRHAHHSRRQRLSLAGGGGAGRFSGDRAALPDRADARRRARRDDRRGRAGARFRRRPRCTKPTK